MGLGLASLYTTTWTLVEHKSTRKAVLQSVWIALSFNRCFAPFFSPLCSGVSWHRSCLSELQTPRLVLKVHMSSCALCFFSSWFLASWLGATLPLSSSSLLIGRSRILCLLENNSSLKPIKC